MSTLENPSLTESSDNLMTFDSPLAQSSYIKVIGVGGGGNNAVNHMYRNGISGVDFIVSNTDKKALDGSPVREKLVLGKDGLGAGGRPTKARKAAEEKADEIKELFEHNTKMVFITAGMGGGTGTGAAPVIARLAKEIKLENEDEDEPSEILVVAVVTTPFLFEGNRRVQQAQEGVEELAKYVDSLLVIDNEKLLKYGNLVLTEAFSMANDVLLTAVKSIAEIITLNAFVNIDFRDVYTVMEKSGTALMGIGESDGENRAIKAAQQATTSMLTDANNLSGAKNVLLYLAYSPEHQISMQEMKEVTEFITDKTGSKDTNVIWGTGFDESLDEKVKITLIVTGFDQNRNPGEKDEEEMIVDDKGTDQPTAPQPPIPQPTHTTTHEFAPPLTPNPNSSYGVVDQVTPTGNEEVQAPVQDTVETPHIEVSQPTPQDEAADTPSKGRIIPLYGEAEEEPNNTVSNPQGQDSDETGIRLISPSQDEQVAIADYIDKRMEGENQLEVAGMITRTAESPVSEPKEKPVAKIGLDEHDRAARMRMARMKYINGLLHNHPNGAQIVASMKYEELTGESIPEEVFSEGSQSAPVLVDANGNVLPNESFYNNPD